MDTKKLRQKILDLAIHGKLVPQDPNDEPASVLLERIRAEKEQLIKEGKIKPPKKSKNTCDRSHYRNEVPYTLPDGWVWCSINDIAESILYGVSESAKTTGKYKLLRITDIQNDIVDWPSVPSTDYEESKVGLYLLRDKDLLFARTGATVGKSYLSKDTPEYAIYASYLIRVRLSQIISPQYVKCYFESGFYWEQIVVNSVGVGQPNVNGTILGGLSIPLPPREEQDRIVAVTSEILKTIASIMEEQTGMEKEVNEFKQKILDLAIHGKLVPQDPSDEPAIELLKRVNPTFEPSDNLHYEGGVPDGWSLCTLGEVSNYGQCISVRMDEIDNDAWVLELEDIEKDTGRVLRRVAKKDRNSSGIRHQFKKGQVLYSKLRTYLNKVLVACEDGFCTTEIIPITPIDGINPQYLSMVLRSQYFLDYTAQCGYGVKMPRLGTHDARKAVIPIPPTKEQLRIVDKTREIFAGLEIIATLNAF